ncbi:MAG TPA: family 78 glycoside hydrolase catalytic domain [Prolixibacteraceae bacterium]|nr:family 78 glycoside hydrolase catalytic domain [Prolixibacteraceae bacterium]
MLEVELLKTEYKTNPIGVVTNSPRLSWIIKSDQKNVVQTAWQVICSGSESFSSILWDSGKAENDQSIHVEYKGSKLQSAQRIFWKVKVWDNHGNESDWSDIAYWEMGFLEIDDWKAKWITSSIPENTEDSTPAPFFRKEFKAQKQIAKATIYASAKGLYELSINGKNISNDLFNPGWTSYQQRTQYQAYDVSSLLSEGNNVIGAIVGDGWYRGYLAWQGKKNTYGNKTALIIQLKISYSDGTTALVCTDESWKCSTGPILKSDIYNGETYDARLEEKGWDMPGFDDSHWQDAIKLPDDTSKLIASEGEPVRITKEIPVIEKIITPKGELVFDFGQNMVGWVKIRLKGKTGDKITLHHAEVLDQEGNFYLDNLREAKAEDCYVFAEEEEICWSPRFTFHGFRYVRITDFTGEINPENLSGLVIHSDMELTGQFECSDPLINQLHHNIEWGLRGNFLDVPTDCPQRDERLGWTGDAQVFAPTASFIMNTASFYSKWMKDFMIEQKSDGSIPWVVPNVVPDGGGTGWSDGFGATGWSDAAIIIPWVVYQTFGDKRILENQYESMKGWEEYMIRHAGDRYIFDYGFHFGDWLSFAEYMSYHYNAPDYGYAGAYTEKELIATAYYYYSTGLMEQIATILGKTDDALRYAAIRPKIKAAFLQEFMTPTGRLTSNSQTAYTLALAFGLYDDDLKKTGAKRLAKDVRHFEHLTTGFLGTPLLLDALSDNGYEREAFMLLFNKRYPSWLYPVTKGATTIWERWDCIKPDGSFQTPGMNSFNHYAYGAVGNWIYSQVGGLKMKEAGYKAFVVQPLIPAELHFARLTYKSMYGTIFIDWERTDNKLLLNVKVPVNTTAEIIFPEGYVSAGESTKVGSGEYRFELLKNS